MTSTLLAHLVFVPLTLVAGFFVGWIFRAEVASKTARRRGGPAGRPRASSAQPQPGEPRTPAGSA